MQKELQVSLVPAVGRAVTAMEKNISKSVADELRPIVTRSPNVTLDKDFAPRLAAEIASRLPSASDIATTLQVK